MKFENIQSVKDLDIMNASNMKSSQQCKYAANKTKKVLGFINKNCFLR